MKTINYIKLYKYYSEQEGLDTHACLRNIWRVRKLPKTYKELISQILDGITPSFEYNGISLKELVENENMSAIQAIMFLDWLRRDPVSAFSFMRSGRYRTEIDPISDKTKSELLAILDKKGKSHVDASEAIYQEDKSGEDITVEDPVPEENSDTIKTSAEDEGALESEKVNK